MAQVLKENTKKLIIEAAKKEFSEKGYKDASMRTIAKQANMTVGNLYRYFKSKEDINKYILGPTYKELESLIKKYTKKEIQTETRVFDVKPSVGQISIIFDDFSEKLVEIYYKNKDEFSILLNDSTISKEILNWFTNIISSLTASTIKDNTRNINTKPLVSSYAYAMYNGLKQIFNDSESNKEDIKILLKTYFHSFLFIFNHDIERFVQ